MRVYGVQNAKQRQKMKGVMKGQEKGPNLDIAYKVF